jgi:hypothetical protein
MDISHYNRLTYIFKKRYKPRWLKHLRKSCETFENEYNKNVEIVRGLIKGLKKLCTYVDFTCATFSPPHHGFT